MRNIFGRILVGAVQGGYNRLSSYEWHYLQPFLSHSCIRHILTRFPLKITDWIVSVKIDLDGHSWGGNNSFAGVKIFLRGKFICLLLFFLSSEEWTGSIRHQESLRGCISLWFACVNCGLSASWVIHWYSWNCVTHDIVLSRIVTVQISTWIIYFMFFCNSGWIETIGFIINIIRL